jgi:hypothetical protein
VVPAASTKPVAHASHVRSAVALPAVKASPAGQVVDQAVQPKESALRLNPDAQASQTAALTELYVAQLAIEPPSET